jgi:hypothetical protein
MPRVFWIVAVGIPLIILAIIVVLVGSTAIEASRERYDVVKDLVVPLVAPLLILPITAILVPSILFYFVPQSQSREKVAVELLTAYHMEEMRSARNQAWRYFTTEMRTLPKEEQINRLSEYVAYLSEPRSNTSVPPDKHEHYQKLNRVLDYFTMVNAYIERDAVDRDMIRSFLAYYYLWWNDEVMEPLRNTPGWSDNPAIKQIKDQKSPKHKPAWWDGLRSLHELCKPRA